MKLIDIEPIIKILKDEYEVFAKEYDNTNLYTSPITVAKYSVLMAEVDAIIGLLESTPEADAIPIGWIESTMKLAELVGAKEYADHLVVLLSDWQLENN